MTTCVQAKNARARRVATALVMPRADDAPAFFIEVVLGGCKESPLEWRYPRITWHCPGGFSSGGMYSSIAWRQKQLGRYACHLVAPRHDGGPLLPAVVELPLDVAREILEAFTSGTVRNEAVRALRAAVEGVSP